MECRKLPHGNERIGVPGLGMSGIQKSSGAEIETVVRRAIDSGVNFFDLCGGAKNIYAPFGRGIAGRRERMNEIQRYFDVRNRK